MSEIKYTPEPWQSNDEVILAKPNYEVARCHCPLGSFSEETANAARIVACVNAMAGIEDPKKLRETWEVVRHLELDAFQNIKQERDALLESLEDIVSRFQSCIHGGNGELADDKPAIEKAKAAINISIKQRAIGK